MKREAETDINLNSPTKKSKTINGPTEDYYNSQMAVLTKVETEKITESSF